MSNPLKIPTGRGETVGRCDTMEISLVPGRSTNTKYLLVTSGKFFAKTARILNFDSFNILLRN